MGKKYKYRNGEPARVLCTDRPSDGSLHVISIEEDGDIICHTLEGYFYSDKTASNYDLIEVSPYEDFKIDDKVIVWDIKGMHFRRHFAGVDKEGRPLTWVGGLTSYTGHHTNDWDYCEKYTGE